MALAFRAMNSHFICYIRFAVSHSGCFAVLSKKSEVLNFSNFPSIATGTVRASKYGDPWRYTSRRAGPLDGLSESVPSPEQLFSHHEGGRTEDAELDGARRLLFERLLRARCLGLRT